MVKVVKWLAMRFSMQHAAVFKPQAHTLSSEVHLPDTSLLTDGQSVKKPECEIQRPAQDLREIVEELQSGGEEVKDGMAPVYGLASVSPDRNIIGEFLVAYQDVLLSG